VDIGLSLVFIALCGAVLWHMHGVPPSVFEPLGTAPVPRAMAVVILVLAVIVLVRALHQLRAPAAAPAEPPAHRPRPLVAAGLDGCR
jgi:putative tricarboxylic transport membrane protein